MQGNCKGRTMGQKFGSIKQENSTFPPKNKNSSMFSPKPTWKFNLDV